MFGVLVFDTREGISARTTVDDLLWDRSLAITHKGERIEDLLAATSNSQRFDLGTVALITRAWAPWRMARALQNLGPGCRWAKWKQDRLNHVAAVWHPWPLLWVSNGNHSATAAALKGGGRIKCEEAFDATPLLRVVTTNGRQWFGQGGQVLGRVRSMPMAGIFEIGRRLIRLKPSSQ